MHTSKALPCLLLLLSFPEVGVGQIVTQPPPPVKQTCPTNESLPTRPIFLTAKPQIINPIEGYTVEVLPVEVLDCPVSLNADGSIFKKVPDGSTAQEVANNKVQEAAVVKANLYAALNAYKCAPPFPIDPLKDHTASIGDEVIYRPDDSKSRVINLDEKLTKSETVCVVEEIYLDSEEYREKHKKDCEKNSYPCKDKLMFYTRSEDIKIVGRDANDNAEKLVTNELTASPRSKRTYARITTGVDVSAAASADPAANFMADLSFDAPFSNLDSSLYRRYSANGYLRLASIAQPGAINGIASPATYIKPLTDSTPNALV